MLQYRVFKKIEWHIFINISQTNHVILCIMTWFTYYLLLSNENIQLSFCFMLGYTLWFTVIIPTFTKSLLNPNDIFFSVIHSFLIMKTRADILCSFMRQFVSAADLQLNCWISAFSLMRSALNDAIPLLKKIKHNFYRYYLIIISLRLSIQTLPASDTQQSVIQISMALITQIEMVILSCNSVCILFSVWTGESKKDTNKRKR